MIQIKLVTQALQGTDSPGWKRITNSFLMSFRPPKMGTPAGFSCMRTMVTRSLSALPAFRMKGTPHHLRPVGAPLSLSHH